MNTTLLSRSLHWLWSRPRRALLAVFGFVVIAGVVGGPVAGARDGSGVALSRMGRRSGSLSMVHVR